MLLVCHLRSQQCFYVVPVMRVTYLLLGLFSSAVLSLCQERSKKKLLCRACQEDDLIWVLTFLEKVCSVNCVSSTGDTPLI